ncbi:MAG: helix-turn-helix domain-containing protein [Anaerolineae bacterium]|nr:helix-turn-helix domain-containing protein [Anaerolineae bacterium]
MTVKTRSVPVVFSVIHFGSVCLACRLEIGLKAQEAAKLLPFDVSTLLAYERGAEANMKMQNFLALCSLYDLNPADFFELG